jgi:hypothetical protein
MGFTLLCGAIGFALFLVLHVFIWQARPSSSPRVFLLLFLMAMGAGLSIWIYITQHGADRDSLVTLLLFHALMGMFYLNFYGSLARSVSITLLLEILKAHPKPAPFDQLLLDYKSSARFYDRVKIMHDIGWVKMVGEEVHLTKKGERMASLVGFMSTLLSGKLEG